MNGYNIIKVTPDRFCEVLEIYAAAREFMRNTGNPNQWKTFRPEKATLENDIALKRLYAVEKDGELFASFVLMGEDPIYNELIEGAWLNNKPYHTLHRVASNGKAHGMMEIIVGFAKSFGLDVRIDTHDDNKVMQHLLEKNGFVRCGRIPIYGNEERVTFHYAVPEK